MMCEYNFRRDLLYDKIALVVAVVFWKGSVILCIFCYNISERNL